MYTKVIVYSTPFCIYCKMLKDWLAKNNISFESVDLSSDAVKRDEIIAKTGQMGVPVVDIDGEMIVGFDRPRLSEVLGIK